MLKDGNNQIIFAIAYCELCREYFQLSNEITASLDAERKISKHAGIKHNYSKDGMGWTKVEREMAQIRRNPGFKEGNL